ncbi:MAG: hypothetical protein JRJ11_09490 [Deltaproteobacteria bacterium]|nr:hypothetical protein [Deltaproteobacteria bacterium]MBW2035243.1 hypothetical protein [Deltaproteobacteria bacterium]
MKKFTTNPDNPKSAWNEEKASRLRSLHLHLNPLFPRKQKELVLKRLKGEPFTKTEREYYSRVVKKKLEALASNEIREIATKLTKKK